MNQVSISDLLGKRCLITLSRGMYVKSVIDEYKVLEISPSGNWAKLQNIHGNKFWQCVTDISLIEVLLDVVPSRLPENAKVE